MYLPALTGLRGLAACWVLVFHLWEFSGSPPLILPLGFASLDLTALAGCGYLGVDLFFVLSGFLLSIPFHRAALGTARTPDVRRYLVRRCRRVLPAYYVQLTIIAATLTWLGQTPAAGNLAAHAALLQNLFPAYALLNGVYWTMPIEWDFYLALPLIGLLMRRFRVLAVFAALFCASVAFRWICYAAYGNPEWSAWIDYGRIMQLPARLDEFGCGVLGAWWFLRAPLTARRAHHLLWAGALGLVGALVALSTGGRFIVPPRFPGVLFYFSWLGLSFGAIVLGAAARQTARALLDSRVVAWLGLISYSLYLWHYPLLQVAQHMDWVATGSASALLRNIVLLTPPILGVSWLSQHIVERPFLRTRARAATEHGMPASLES
jgi:peptidoglycan/LPS O-acetylase OafA/YrhL